LRRLFSTFAQGWPGAGLLLLRLVAGLEILIHGSARLGSGLPVGLNIAVLLGMAAGIFLLAGLWTPVAGSLVALLGLGCFVSQPGDPSSSILLGTIGMALALVGPGVWSVDARLFGWKRIDIYPRER
jgi:putative oxidoreductase